MDDEKRFPGPMFPLSISESIAQSEERIFEGSVADLVKVRMSSKLALRSIDIDPSLMTPERRFMLEELIVSTVNDAVQKALAVLDEERGRAMQSAAAKMFSSINPDMIKDVTATIRAVDDKGIPITDPKAMEAITDMIKKLTKDMGLEEKE